MNNNRWQTIVFLLSLGWPGLGTTYYRPTQGSKYETSHLPRASKQRRSFNLNLVKSSIMKKLFAALGFC